MPLPLPGAAGARLWVWLSRVAWSCCMQMHPPDAPCAWKPRSTCSSGKACYPHAFCGCPSAAPGSAQKAAPRHACSRTALIGVPDKQCPWVLRLLRHAYAAQHLNWLQRHSIHIDSDPGRPKACLWISPVSPQQDPAVTLSWISTKTTTC